MARPVGTSCSCDRMNPADIDGRQYDNRVDAHGRFRLCENPRGSGKLPADDR
jgi:hypothetical protein